MSRDPNDGNLKDPASLHKYLYANGDPVGLADPTGRGAQVEFQLTFVPGGTAAAGALPEVAGQAAEAWALIQNAAAQGYLTTQYLLSLAADIAHASGLEKWFACAAGGLLLSKYLDENHITGYDKTLVLTDWTLVCGGWYPAPGWPPGPGQK